MNIFVAGVHGVGKTYLASRLPKSIGLLHTSASRLIKEEQATPNWGTDKRVSDVQANQIALAAAVRRHNAARTRLLLDGHFVLLDTEGVFKHLDAEVFRPLNLDGVVLIEADAPTVAARIRIRDQREADLAHIVDFIAAEREQAQLVCDGLGIPLVILESPSVDAFAQAVAKAAQKTA